MKLKDLQRYLVQYKKAIWVAMGILVVLFIVLATISFSVRKGLLNKALSKVERKFRDDYAITFKVDEAKFSGLNSIGLRHVKLLPDDREKLADIGYMEISIQLWPLLFGEVKIGDLLLDDAKVSFVKKDSLSNYDFLFSKKTVDSIPQQALGEKNYASLIEGVIKQVFFKVPRNMEMKNFELSYRDNDMEQRVYLPKGFIDHGEFSASLFLNSNEAQWNLRGTVNPNKQKIHLVIAAEQKNVELPFLKGKNGISINFD